MDQTISLVRKAFDKIDQSNPKLSARLDISGWEPGFLRFADGDCDILITEEFPTPKDMKYLSWHLPVGSVLNENIIGQQRVFVVVNKGNAISSISFEQISKILIKAGKAVSWNDIGGNGSEIHCFLEPAKSRACTIIGEKCLKEQVNGGIVYQAIRDGVTYCTDAKGVLDKVRGDRDAIGFISDPQSSLADVKILAISSDSSPSAVAPLPGPVFQKEYPLSGWLLLYIHPDAKDAKELCDYLRGSIASGILTGEGYTTQYAIDHAKAQARLELVKSGKGQPITAAGLGFYSKIASDISNEFTIARSPVIMNYTSTTSDLAAIEQFLNTRKIDMVFLENPANKLITPKMGQAWEDAMPVPFVYGSRSVAIIVNSVNKLDSMTLDQVREVFTGATSDWNILGKDLVPAGTGDVSSPVFVKSDKPSTDARRGITLYGLASPVAGASGNVADPCFALFTRVIGQSKLASYQAKKDSAETIAAVAMDPGGIAFVDASQLYVSPGKAIKVLAIQIGTGEQTNTIQPTAENCEKGTYPLSQQLYLYVNPKASDVAKDFVAFIITSGKSTDSRSLDAGKPLVDAFHKFGLICRSMDVIPPPPATKPAVEPPKNPKDKPNKPSKPTDTQPSKSDLPVWK